MLRRRGREKPHCPVYVVLAAERSLTWEVDISIEIREFAVLVGMRRAVN